MEQKRNFIGNILTCFLAIFIVAGVGYLFKDQLFKVVNSDGGTCYTTCENKVTVTDKGISDSVEKIYDAVVLIENYQKERLVSIGTGFVYKTDNKYGYIITNYHVINKNTGLKVILSNDEVVDATYLGGDEFIDVAVIAIPKDKVLKVANIGKSSDSKVGDTVFTVGTPVGHEYKGTVTRGILSGKDRLVDVTDEEMEYVMKVLQTDAAINPGNSGGPLVNINGEVIGINSIKLADEKIESMGFAIAIEDVMLHMNTFEAGKEIERPFLGISMHNVTDTYALARLGIKVPSNITKGVVIASTEKGSSVDGILKVGDVVTKLGKNEVNSIAYLRYELFKHNIGDKLSITFIRDGKENTSTVTLKAKK